MEGGGKAGRFLLLSERWLPGSLCDGRNLPALYQRNKRARDLSTACIVSALSTTVAFHQPMLHVVNTCQKIACLILSSLFLLGSRIVCKPSDGADGDQSKSIWRRDLCVKLTLTKSYQVFYNVYIYTLVPVPCNLIKAHNCFEVHVFELL